MTTFAAQIEQALTEHRLAAATGKPWYMREGGTRSPKDHAQTYACKCRNWEGTHGQHPAHVAQVIAALVPDPEVCRKSGQFHGIRGLVSMGPRCPDWSAGWKAGAKERLKGKSE